ncbi:MAG: MerR family transcriptional regulator [Planctomycetota bacterium]|jgi:DNA-binding transcriptional MerR regulator
MAKVGLYKMNTITQRTGFSPALLRAWERRHGLLEPERTEGGHRLYTESDLEVLTRVREHLDAGRAIGEIASVGRKRLLAESAKRTAVAPAELPKNVEAKISSLSREIVEGAVAVSEGAIESALDNSFGLLSPHVAVERVVIPALVAIGELWAEGKCTVAGEHLASAKITGRLLKLLETVNPAGASGAKVAIAACLPDEQHEIGALVAASEIARHNYRVSYLGACLPLEDLERACLLLSPSVVCLSVSREALLGTHKPRLLELVGRLPKSTRVFLGGRGVEGPDAELEAAGVVLILLDGPSLADRLRLLHRPPARKTKAKTKGPRR